MKKIEKLSDEGSELTTLDTGPLANPEGGQPVVSAEQAPPEPRPAPTHDEVAAYWAPGRAKDEAAKMMEGHQAVCARQDCEKQFPYIPQPDEEGIPTYLLCHVHSS